MKTAGEKNAQDEESYESRLLERLIKIFAVFYSGLAFIIAPMIFLSLFVNHEEVSHENVMVMVEPDDVIESFIKFDMDQLLGDEKYRCDSDCIAWFMELNRLLGAGEYCDIDCLWGYHQYWEGLNPGLSSFDQSDIDTDLFYEYYHQEWVPNKQNAEEDVMEAFMEAIMKFGVDQNLYGDGESLFGLDQYLFGDEAFCGNHCFVAYCIQGTN